MMNEDVPGGITNDNENDGNIGVVDENYYFWLGADGEVTPVYEEDFEDRIFRTRREREDFLNVR